MLVGTFRTRSCAACGARTDDPAARWCGTCGDPLTSPGPPGAPRRQLPRAAVLTLAIVIAVVGATVAASQVRGVGWPATSTALRDATVAPPSPDALTRVERRPPAPAPPVAEPTCPARDDTGCFLWTVATHGDLVTVVAHDGVLLSAEHDDMTITARSLEDGRVRWRAPHASKRFPRIIAAGDLVLHRGADGWTARELATGAVRWTADELTDVGLHEARAVGDQLLVRGERTHRPLHEEDAAAAVVAGLDPATGALRWTATGWATNVAADGSVVVAAEDGHVEVLDAGGAPVASCQADDHLVTHALASLACAGDQAVRDNDTGLGPEGERVDVTKYADRLAFLSQLVGPYVVHHSDPDGAGDVIVAGADRGGEVARLPAGTWPVETHAEAGWTADLGGVAVLVGPRSFAAIALPDTDRRGPGTLGGARLAASRAAVDPGTGQILSRPDTETP